MVDIHYLCWPSCLVYPLKIGLAGGSMTMRWSAMLESVCKDIEGVFGILKKRFAFLKFLNQPCASSTAYWQFIVTCCILHNILLKEDGHFNNDLTNYPSWVKARLNKITNDPRGFGQWIVLDELDGDTIKAALVETVNSPDLESQWLACDQALMNYFQFR